MIHRYRHNLENYQAWSQIYVTLQHKKGPILSLFTDWMILFVVLGNNLRSKIQRLRKMIIEMILTASVDIVTVLTGKD